MLFTRLYLALFVLPLSAAAAVSPTAHWEYAGEHGPAHWSHISKDYEGCALGHTQSPIDIRSAEMHADLPKLEFHYAPSPLHIINNGHTIQVNMDPGSTLKIGDKSYTLVQFHFHTPSEERIKGKPYDMVAHLVHKDDAGKLAVVAVLFKVGAENPTLPMIWQNMPRFATPEHTVASLNFNAADLLPTKAAYYNFEGSLTTPPCSEGVNWFVMKQPVSLSAKQLKFFHAYYDHNARPVQALNSRVVKESAE